MIGEFVVRSKSKMRNRFLIIAFLASLPANNQTTDRKAMEYYSNGMNEYARKNYPRAVFEFSRAIRIDSAFIQAWENRGVAKFYLQDYEGAIDDFNKALEINPDDYNTIGRRGWARYDLQDLNGAIEDFTTAIGSGGNDAEYYLGRGEAKYKLKEYNEAVADFSKVIRFSYGGKEQRRKAFFWRGIIKMDLGQRESGCLDLKKSRKMGYEKAYEVLDIYCR